MSTSASASTSVVRAAAGPIIQQYKGRVMTAEEVFAKLKEDKANGRAPWWKLLEPIMEESDHPEGKDKGTVNLAKVACTQCSSTFSVVNLSRMAMSHFKDGQCSKQRKRPAASGDDDVVDMTLPTKRQNTLASFVVPAALRKKAVDHVVDFVLSSCPLQHIEHPHLKAAFATLGVDLPSRKSLSTTILDSKYESARQAAMQPLATGFFAVATDGWRSRLAGQGTPLLNVMALLPNGGSVFVKALPVGGVTKDAAWLVQQHSQLVVDLSGGDTQRVCGILMDNTKANRKALVELEGAFPKLLGVGCQAHGLSLLIKDVANDKKCPKLAKTLANCQFVSNTINDSEKVKALLHKHQHGCYGKTKAIAVHCPTRFGTLVFIAKDILRSKDALRAAVISDDWGEASSGCAGATRFFELITGSRSTFWPDVKDAVDLLQPVMDAIHQLEADKPMLSQLLPVYLKLRDHFKAWYQRRTDAAEAAALDGSTTNVGRPRRNGEPAVATVDDVLTTFEDRYQKLYHPSFAAAYIVDPIYFSKEAGTESWVSAVADLTAQQRQDALNVFTKLAGGNKLAVGAELLTFELSTLPEGLTTLLPALTERTPLENGRVKVAAVDLRRKWWTRKAAQTYPLLSGAAERLLSMHATTCATERNWSRWGLTFTKLRNRTALQRGEKLVFLRQNSCSLGQQSDEEIMMKLLGEDSSDSDTDMQ